MKRYSSIARSRPLILATVFVLALFLPRVRLIADGEQRFSTPEAAVKALKAAVDDKDTNALRAIFGPAARELISSDVVQATEEWRLFEERLMEKTTLVLESATNVVLQLGADHWPFPIPLVKGTEGWHFDVAAGKEEILNRRIGRNEVGAIGVCRAYVDAQREYATQDHKGDQVLEYAQRLRSAPGTHDGLYWPLREGGDLSPLGPLVAQAWHEGYRHKSRILVNHQSPYHGYYFMILTRQGRHAPGGKYNYIINGHMIGGFALVAWPADWGNTGIMTFIVNQQGKVFQKNLGPKTAKVAGEMTTYDPDKTWQPVPEEYDH